MPDPEVIDSDGHILEPKCLWDDYLEPQYRGGIRWVEDNEGLEYLEIAGVRSRVSPGALGGVGGYPAPNGDRTAHFNRRKMRYLDGAPPGSMDPHERIAVLDQEGIDIALIYPTIGLIWEEHVADRGLAAALCRAYNDWLFDFCRPYPRRLVPVAHVALIGVEEAVAEMRRAAKLGAKAFYLRPDLVNGRTVAHPDFDPIWATAQDLDLPVAPHVVVRTETGPVRSWTDSLTSGPQTGLIFGFTYLILPVQAAFTAMLTAGVFERFSRLKYVILESGGGWIAHWLDRLKSKYKVGKGFSMLKHEPEYYFRRQCFISVEPDEKTTPFMAQLLGADRFVWASDFPHIDAELGVVRELKANIASLSPADQAKILGANARAIYSLGPR